MGSIKNKTCIIVDDIIDSGGTIVNAVEALKKAGANDVYIFVTHGVLSGDAVNKIQKSKKKNLLLLTLLTIHQKLKKVTKLRYYQYLL